MRMRELGSTRLMVSEIGLGLAAIGRPGYITLGRDRDLGLERGEEGMRRRAHALLDAARALGIVYFDAARSYGRAEEFLASWLDKRGLGRDDVVVGSKWGYRYTAGWQVGAEVNEIKDHSAASFRRQIGETTALLGDRLRLYQIHSATLESGVLDDAAVIAALGSLRDSGVAVGLSVSGPRQAGTVRKALAVRRNGGCLFQTVQATWNLLEPSVARALEEARDAGLGVIVKEALANGRLVDRGEGSEPAAPRPLLQVAARLGATADVVAIAAALAQPWRSVVLSGAVTPAQLAANVSASALRLTPGDLAELGTVAEPPERYWATRAALPWS